MFRCEQDGGFVILPESDETMEEYIQRLREVDEAPCPKCGKECPRCRPRKEVPHARTL